MQEHTHQANSDHQIEEDAETCSFLLFIIEPVRNAKQYKLYS
jgi:hypothetical protein